ncbi:MAG: response regulator [Acidobacteria bacterium]|nr:response regulator [Acidobacteriota bacterium]
MTTPSLGRLLIVDDDVGLMITLRDMLAARGYETVGLTSAKNALEALRLQDFDLLLTDLMMPEMDGIALLRAALEIDPHLVGIVMTGQGTVQTAVEAMKIGAFDYLLKPFKLNAMLPLLSRAMGVRRLRVENLQLRETVAIYELSQATGFTLDSRMILDKVADAALELGNADGASIWLPAANGSDLRVRVVRGQYGEDLPDHNATADGGLPGWVARHLESVVLPDQLSDPRLQPIASHEQTRPSITVPMLASSKLVGVLMVHARIGRRPFRPGQVKAISVLANIAASALENVELYEQLRSEEEKYHALVENLNEVIYKVAIEDDPHGGRVEFLSRQVKNILGYQPEEFEQDPGLWFRIIHPDDVESMMATTRRLLAIPEAGHREYRLRHKETLEYRWMEDRAVPVFDQHGKVIAIQGVARDVTDHQNLQAQLLQAQKMEAVGRLAGGVAHDFNNLLTAIIGYSNLMEQSIPPDDPMRSNLEEITKAGERAAALTGQLLTFSRKQTLRPKVLNLNDVVGGVRKMLQRMIGEDVELVTSLDSDLGSVKVDPGQIEQIIMNLAVNARDAMSQGGRLTIETGDLDLEKDMLSFPMRVEAGRYVTLTVIDTGEGMNQETLSHIFEPFFTTKEQGKGTGLGLSTVYGIVQQSKGSIGVQSDVGGGSSFRVYLPRVDEPPELAGRRAATMESLAGSETVLLVEDDEMVRRLAGYLLRNGGYTVLEAENAGEAIRLCESHGKPIQLMLTDVVMPRMNGRELAERVTPMRPEMKVLYMSGYAVDALFGQGVLNPGTHLLSKPFTPHDLARKIRETLDAPLKE